MTSATTEPQTRTEGRLAGRRILVVGAGQQGTGLADVPVGNGRAIATLAAREGAAVAALDIDADAAAATVAAIEADGGTAVPFVADASDADACAGAVEGAAEALGGLDGLVLAVGVAAKTVTLENALGHWDAMFATNVRSHFLACRSALPLLADGSSVLFLSSIAAAKAITYDPAYDSTKRAVEGLCRHTALEGAPRRIRANTIRLGSVDTQAHRVTQRRYPGMEAHDPSSVPNVNVPIGFVGSAWDIAAVATFLLSDDSRFITGQTITVDGGATTLSPGRLDG